MNKILHFMLDLFVERHYTILEWWIMHEIHHKNIPEVTVMATLLIFFVAALGLVFAGDYITNRNDEVVRQYINVEYRNGYPSENW